jgi:hypothetical protein
VAASLFEAIGFEVTRFEVTGSDESDIQRSNTCGWEGVEQAPGSGLADGGRVRVHSIGVVEVVVSVDIGFAEHSARRAGNARAVDDDLGGHGLIEMRIHDGESDVLALIRSGT